MIWSKEDSKNLELLRLSLEIVAVNSHNLIELLKQFIPPNSEFRQTFANEFFANSSNSNSPEKAEIEMLSPSLEKDFEEEQELEIEGKTREGLKVRTNQFYLEDE